jgi:hypothetical protein
MAPVVSLHRGSKDKGLDGEWLIQGWSWTSTPKSFQDGLMSDAASGGQVPNKPAEVLPFPASKLSLIGRLKSQLPALPR